MLEFICPTCGKFDLDEVNCESCTGVRVVDANSTASAPR